MCSIFFRYKLLYVLLLFLLFSRDSFSIVIKPKFQVIAFYTGKNDQAHISYVSEALKCLPKIAEENNFGFTATNDWSNLNAEFLAGYQVVLFLDTRPDKPEQREAFQKYMESGGAWMGFHFSAFALSPSAYPQNWDWYHEEFSARHRSETS